MRDLRRSRRSLRAKVCSLEECLHTSRKLLAATERDAESTREQWRITRGLVSCLERDLLRCQIQVSEAQVTKRALAAVAISAVAILLGVLIYA